MVLSAPDDARFRCQRTRGATSRATPESPAQRHETQPKQSSEAGENKPAGKLPRPSAARPALIRTAALNTPEPIHHQGRESDERNHAHRGAQLHSRHCRPHGGSVSKAPFARQPPRNAGVRSVPTRTVRCRPAFPVARASRVLTARSTSEVAATRRWRHVMEALTRESSRVAPRLARAWARWGDRAPSAGGREASPTPTQTPREARDRGTRVSLRWECRRRGRWAR
jgi:hypothetical protein